MVLSKEELLAAGKVADDDLLEVEIPGVGSVMVRPLSRAEANRVTDGKDSAEREARIISMGMVEPKLTLEETRAWMAGVKAGLVTALCETIATVSAMDEGAGKAEVERFPD